MKKKHVEKKNRTSFNFLKFLFNKEQLPDWMVIIGLCVIGYIIIKICYPYPITMSDSLGYIQAAEIDKFSFYRPFGYSFFIQIIHGISSNIHAVFIAQMIIYFLATAMFSFTIKYFFKPNNKIIWYILLVIFTLSPMGLYLANCIMSDLLYGVIIYLMISSFIFVIQKRSWIGLFLFMIFLYISLFIRYSSMVFPVVFIPLFFMIKGNIRWVGIIGTVFISVIFNAQIKRDMKENTKFDQFSTGFDGWQIANNTLHIIPFIDLDPEDIKDKELRKFHEFVLLYNDSILKITDNGKIVSSKFLWFKDLPLKDYLSLQIKENQQTYAHNWIRLGSTIFKDYGWFLIKKYPFKFMRYYYLLNAKSVFYPESLGILYNDVPISSSKETSWYNIKEDEITDAKYPVYSKFLANFDRILWSVSWIAILAVSILALINKKKIKFNSNQKKTIWAIFIFGVIYYASVVFASPIEFRYWFAIRCVNFAYFCIFLNELLRMKKDKQNVS